MKSMLQKSYLKTDPMSPVVIAGRAIKSLAAQGTDFSTVAMVKNILKNSLSPTRVNEILGKQMNAHVTEKDWADLAMKVTEASKSDDFSGVLAQVFQPKSGSDNFTNKLTPGQPSPIIQARGDDPKSSSNIAGGRYGSSKETAEQTTSQATDVMGEFSENDYSKQPKYQVNSGQRGVPDPKTYQYGREADLFSRVASQSPGTISTTYKGKQITKAFLKKAVGEGKTQEDSDKALELR